MLEEMEGVEVWRGGGYRPVVCGLWYGRGQHTNEDQPDEVQAHDGDYGHGGPRDGLGVEG